MRVYVCVCVFSLACLCFDSPKGPTVLCHEWELSCHECDPINTDHIYECWEAFYAWFFFWYRIKINEEVATIKDLCFATEQITF